MSRPSRLRVTFVGHQGWALDAGGPVVLVDPLLEPGIGDEPRPYLELYPPRDFRFDLAPPVAAVLLTHEHPDHFHLPSLAKLPRAVPIWLSANASEAAHRVIAELGFTVHPFGPGARLATAGLELVALTPSGRTRMDEWDVVPFLARDTGGHGSFLSTIDLSLTERLIAEAARLQPRPGLWAVPDNDMNLSDLHLAMPTGDRTQSTARGWRAQLELLQRAWGPVQAALVYGGGFSFPSELDWLNARAFDSSPQAIAAVLGEPWHALQPGDAVEMVGGLFRGGRQRSEWLSPKPLLEWPRHSGDEAPVDPFTRVPEGALLSSEEQLELERALDGFAQALYGGPVFEALLELDPEKVAPARAAVGFVVRDLHQRGDRVTFVYQPRAARFTRGSGAPTELAACIEATARDALQALTVQRTPSYAVFGRMRFHQARGAHAVGLDMALYVYLHPLRHPDAFLAAYRRQLARLKGEPVLRAAQGAA
ncbi:MAG: MBL fold metallo-hydrolase [Archangiaceae bacterium]|nr:MBL fold metallo-hydrolase [Archangiaceae bacterium]